ncbi:AAA family ATPase, partial [Candidatus Omnitrophota bacterium]
HSITKAIKRINENKDIMLERQVKHLFIEQPKNLDEFLSLDVTPPGFYVDQILQEEGRTLVSGKRATLKTFVLMNMCLAISSGEGLFLDKFCMKPCRILYCDFEVGKRSIKARLSIMSQNIKYNAENLYIISNLDGIDLSNKEHQVSLEVIIEEFEIKVVVFDTINKTWIGDENKASEVNRLHRYLDSLIEKKKISVVGLRHWRKASKEFKSGGEMMAGSYQWESWCDNHVTLECNSETCVTVKSVKNRNCEAFESFMVKLNPETYVIEYAGDYNKKYTIDRVEEAVNEFNSNEKIQMQELIKKVKDKFGMSKSVLYRLIKDSEVYGTTGGKPSYLIKLDDVGDEQLPGIE